MKKGPLFLNTPIASPEQDIVGMGVYVDALDQAIDRGAQMIGIIAPRGAGKSSVTELLRHRREQEHGAGPSRRHGEERFIKVSLEDHPGAGAAHTGETNRPEARRAPEDVDGEAARLHRSFVSQLAGRMIPEHGAQTVRELDMGGRPRPGRGNLWHWALAAAVVLAAAAWLVLGGGMERFYELLPWLQGSTGALLIVALAGTVCLVVLLLTRLRALFSRLKPSRKPARQRTSPSDEFVEFYRSRLLRPRSILWGWWKKLRRGVHYIAVVEGLEQPDAPEPVVRFLSELYQYCLAEQEAAAYFNRVTFLVSLPPETALSPRGLLRPGDSLYTKVFDYILSLQPINTDHYDALLNGLLEEHRDELKALGLETDGVDELSRLPGMQWIVREGRLGLPEIKGRLNLAFERLEVLQERFPGEPVAFEKCAAAAYLLSAFEEDFYHTDDRAFQKLVDHCLQNPAEETFADGEAACRQLLPGTGRDYQRAVWDLIQARLIDASYRIYFYNSPRDSRLYTARESALMGAILYGEELPGLPELVDELAAKSSPVVEECYRKLQQLGLPLPGFVLELEPLYVAAVHFCFDSVLRKLAALDPSPEAEEKTLQVYRRILSFDSDREVFGEGQARQLCALWRKSLSESALLRLRRMLCQDYPWEIGWYRSLFFNPHEIITPEELELLPLAVDLELIDRQSRQFSRREVDYVVRRFAALGAQDREKLAGAAERFLRESLSLLEIQVMAEPLLDFMAATGHLVPSFEEAVGVYLAALEEGPEKETLFAAYQRQINQAAPWGLSEQTAQRVSGMDRYQGYTPETAQCLRGAGFVTDYVLMSLFQSREVPYEAPDIVDGLRANYQWLLKNQGELFQQIRFDVVTARPELLGEYAFLFGEGCPLITAQETDALSELGGDVERQIMALTPPERVTPAAAEYLCGFFSRRKQSSALTVEILSFASRMEKGAARKFFYGLDFDAVSYRSISDSRRSAARAELWQVLELDKPENKLRFMGATMYLDPAWEEALAPELKTDDALRRAYVDAVNRCEKVTKRTAEIVMGLGPIYGMAPPVTERIFQDKQYFWYVTSRIQWDKRFIMEEGARGEVLWETYMDIFGKKSHKNWDRIKSYMRENEKFLRKIMETGAYGDFTDENRMGLAAIPQNAASIRECIGRGSRFALDYLLQIKGFQDDEAAGVFVDLVCKTPALLASNQLYEHTRGLLTNGNLKAKYTTQRKKL